MADMNRCCGLLTAAKKPVPLKSISVDIQIKGFVADVSSTLTYKNDEQNPLESDFVFPMDDDSAVYSFEAMVDGKKIVAEIQEKKKAQEAYEEAISQGQEAFLLEEDSSSGDIFSCSIGNLPPDQECAVTLSFVKELPLEPDGAVRFVLPAVLNPRFTPRDVGAESVTAHLPRLPSGLLPYTLKLSTTIVSPYGIDRVQSNCGLSPLNYLKEDKTSAQVSLAEEHKFDRDVELLIYYNEVNKPSVIVEAGLPSALPGSLMADATVMLNIYPNFPESQEHSTCGEFIFVMDRSGSMTSCMNSDPSSPRRIDSAKETMVLLLKSLPLGCYFNIFGFGSRFESFFPESVQYTQDSMTSALKKIEGIKADFGGTEILQPLKHIYSKAETPGHPRQLFVFTDGEVGNTKSVIAEVSGNSSNHRCFAFGIGEGASTALIKGMARAGNGTSEFITGKEKMQPKVLQTLKCSLQPVVKDVSVKWTLPNGLESALLSHLPNAIFRGQRSIIYAQLKGKIDEAADADVTLEYTFKDEVFRNKLQFTLRPEAESRLTIHRLAAKAVLRDMERGSDSGQEEVKKRMLELSLQSGVICSLTGFIAINKDLNQPIQGPLIQRNVPIYGAFPWSYCRGASRQPCMAMSCAPGAANPRLKCAMPRSMEFTNYWDEEEGSSNACDLLSLEFTNDWDEEEGSSNACYLLSSGAATQYKLKKKSRSNVRKMEATESYFAALEGAATQYKPKKKSRSNVRKKEATESYFAALEGAATQYKLKGGSNVRKTKATEDYSAALEVSSDEEKKTDSVLRLISLQNADGSWTLNTAFAAALGMAEKDLKANTPGKDVDSAVWATVLALIWLHSTSADRRDEWELLEAKALTWVKAKAGPNLTDFVKAGNSLLKASVDIKVFGL
ncbi:von Willebrand factor A domain-containing protein 5A-like isoform X7 [Ambystoma mexicanum]|uniref:von Willebrand factor A domain-containing protein 5A-like isoform X7 n=1 Tax=Ambystoma mexicanum TaxID=8296 RepID=UPI0037E978DB